MTANALAYPFPACLWQALQQDPQRHLLQYQGQRYRAVTVLAKAQTIARVLQTRALAPGTAVGVAMQRCAELLPTLLGIWLSGHVYVPLAPGSPLARLRQQCEVASLALVLTTPDLQEAMACLPVPLMTIVAMQEAGHSPNPVPTLTAVDGSAATPAYLMFTSGSSGQPKAVQLSHGNLACFFAAVASVWQWPPGLRFLGVSNAGFDISLFELLAPLLFQGQLVMATDDECRDPADLCQLLHEQRIDVVQTTPSRWQLLVSCTGPRPQLRFALSIGEPLLQSLAQQLLPLAAEVWNLYGPTETTIWATAHRVTAADLLPTAPAVVCIGTALPGYQTALDATGELLITGAAVGLGYLGTAATTPQRFGKTTDGSAVYRSGDQCRADAGGALHFLGRHDTQVKLDGHRLELDEIEERLHQHASVLQAACLVKPVPGGAQLLAFLVCRPGALNKNAHGFNEWLATTLPAWMLPHRYLILDQLPLTPNGKLDRQQLRQLADSGEAGSLHGADRCTREVAGIFCRVLGLPGIGINDSFFDLGGSSMLGASLVMSLNQHFGTKLTLRQILATPPTVGLLVKLLKNAGAVGDSAA